MKEKFNHCLALLISFAFFAFLLVEFVLSLVRKTLYTTVSCRTVDALSMSHTVMVCLGLVYFGLYTLLIVKGAQTLTAALSISGVCTEVIFF